MLLCSDGVLHSEHELTSNNRFEHSSARQISMIKKIMFIANKKLRSLRSLRQGLVIIASKTPLALSKFVSLLIKKKTPLASLAPSKLVCVANNLAQGAVNAGAEDWA